MVVHMDINETGKNELACYFYYCGTLWKLDFGPGAYLEDSVFPDYDAGISKWYVAIAVDECTPQQHSDWS
jgi:hypothetical protein